ncbi:hypothetical protein [Streptomyces olivaceus]|uniref:hypothetical protein n=1 Tax=Streptomyces olivaceus TaxID=47716 RepID=UPI0022EEB1B6|nr:hypothetical protein [Streptomyces olivaceus]GHI91698.1 hypothetical protein TPA0905_11690 [Streptomyces olivaceus]
MSTRTLPDHGQYSRYIRHGCRCDLCRAAGRSYRLRLAYDHTNGVARRVDSTQVRVHLERLTAHDWTQDQIAAAAGVDQSTVSLIMSRPGTRVRRSTAAAILDIRLDQDAPVPRGLVDATGSRRRLQALMVLGHTLPEIARRAGAAESSLQQTVDGRWARIKSVTATKVARVYRQLSVTRAPESRFAEQARNHAMAHGWYGPMAWDDIDDPTCRPDPTEPSAPASVHSADVSELAGRGLDDAEIGRRLGVSPRTVLRARAAHGIAAGVAA